MTYEIIERKYLKGPKAWALRLELNSVPMTVKPGVVLRDQVGRTFRVRESVGIEPGWVMVRPVEGPPYSGPSKDVLSIEV